MKQVFEVPVVRHPTGCETLSCKRSLSEAMSVPEALVAVYPNGWRRIGLWVLDAVTRCQL